MLTVQLSTQDGKIVHIVQFKEWLDTQCIEFCNGSCPTLRNTAKKFMYTIGLDNVI